MFFCDFCEMFKNTFLTPPGDYFWFFRSLPKDIPGYYTTNIKMKPIEATMLTLMRTLNMSLSVVITLKAAIMNKLSKSWRFSRLVMELSLVEFRYSEIIVFGIHNNFTYDSKTYAIVKLYLSFASSFVSIQITHYLINLVNVNRVSWVSCCILISVISMQRYISLFLWRHNTEHQKIKSIYKIPSIYLFIH